VYSTSLQKGKKESPKELSSSVQHGIHVP